MTSLPEDSSTNLSVNTTGTFIKCSQNDISQPQTESFLHPGFLHNSSALGWMLSAAVVGSRMDMNICALLLPSGWHRQASQQDCLHQLTGFRKTATGSQTEELGGVSQSWRAKACYVKCPAGGGGDKLKIHSEPDHRGSPERRTGKGGGRHTADTVSCCGKKVTYVDSHWSPSAECHLSE